MFFGRSPVRHVRHLQRVDAWPPGGGQLNATLHHGASLRSTSSHLKKNQNCSEVCDCSFWAVPAFVWIVPAKETHCVCVSLRLWVPARGAAARYRRHGTPSQAGYALLVDVLIPAIKAALAGSPRP